MQHVMSESKESNPVLECGARLIVRRNGLDSDRTAIVVQLKHGLIWISQCERPGDVGERVMIGRRVDGDALYQAPARVEFVPPETYALRRTGEWRRHQRRADVRVSTHGLELTVIRQTPTGDPERERFPVTDLSAGGVSVRAEDSFDVGDEVYCVLELSGEQRYELRAEVVRCSKSGNRVAFRFLDVDHEHHAALLQWVYREQVRRHRVERKRQDGS
jgi:hypothetical protein